MLNAFHMLLAVCGLLLGIAALPLFVELLVLSVAGMLPCRKVDAPPAEGFALAVVVPAHNEQALIRQCVNSLLDQSASEVRVLVVAHNCSDETALRAEAAGATVLVLNDDVGGKGNALDFGFRHALAAGAQGVLVIDADSVVSPNLTQEIAARLHAGAAALQCRYEVADAQTNARMQLAALAFAGMNVLRPRGRSRIGLSCGIFGNGFALSAQTLRRVPYTANSLVEDLEYHLHLIESGLCVEFVDEAAVFGEMPASSAAAKTQRARWEGGRILMRRKWAGPLSASVCRGRIRLLEPLLDLLAFPLATEAGLLAGTVLLGWASHTPSLVRYGLLGLAVLDLYVLASASLTKRPAQALKALAAVPGYMLWKLLLLPKTRLTARAGSAWVRTKRNADD